MKLLSDKTIKVSVCSAPAYLPVVRAVAEKVCELIGFGDEAAGAIVLSVDEALTNIIRHAYKGAADEPIDVEFTPLGGEATGGLRIHLRDYAAAVDITKIKSRDLADVRPGGLGVHIISECMDSVEYSPADGGGTVLTMVKNLPPGESGDA